MKYKVVLERKVTYVATLEVTADNFENAKLRALEHADFLLVVQQIFDSLDLLESRLASTLTKMTGSPSSAHRKTVRL